MAGETVLDLVYQKLVTISGVSPAAGNKTALDLVCGQLVLISGTAMATNCSALDAVYRKLVEISGTAIPANIGQVSLDLIYRKVLEISGSSPPPNLGQTATDLIYQALGQTTTLGAYPASALLALETRRVVAGYAGAAFDLRRASDNATMTANFLASGLLDIATIRAWRGNSSALVSKWYEQSVAARHAVQATGANQPELLLDGFGFGKPAVWFGGSHFLSIPYDAALDLTGDISVVLTSCVNAASGVFITCSRISTFVGWTVSSGASNKLNFIGRDGSAHTMAETTATGDGFQRVLITTRATGGAGACYRQGSANGTAASITNNQNGASDIYIGQFPDASSRIKGMMSAIVVYGSVLGSTDRSAISTDNAAYNGALNPVAPTVGFKGASGLKFIASSYVNAGANLAYERTQPWTIMSAAYFTGRPVMDSAGAMLIYGNAGVTPFPGYEVWVGGNGLIRVRIIHSQPGLNCIDVEGSLQAVLGTSYAAIGVTYDASSTAAGVNIYVNGVRDLNTRVITDALTLSSIGDELYIGNQKGFEAVYFARGALDEIQVHNVERSESYMAAHMTPSTWPTVPDANIDGYWRFDEASGTSAADSSANGFVGTLSATPPVWLGAGP